ncbi:MAG: thiamine pyrophosphate-binding protein [Sphingobacteriia bacterium]|nr:thiamine pyrophosphate-binding protein [Sphingobacteriia bacterium]
MKGSAFFLKTLAKLGVNNIFGIVGGEAQAIQFDEEKDINFYLTRHEFTAGIMADVYSRISGTPQMCYSTFGPGLTNLSTGVCSAMLDRSPILVVSAQIPREEICYNQTHQCIDNVEFMKPLTKYSAQLENLIDIPKIVKEALEIAINGIPGPVYLSFPLDLMKEKIDENLAEKLLNELTPINKKLPNQVNDEKLNGIIEEIKNSNNPIIVVGNQVIREDCCNEIIELANKFNIPVISTLASKGVIPEDHHLFITPGNKYIDEIYQKPLIADIFKSTDLMLLIGYDFGEDLKPSLWKNDKKTIVINSFYEDMGKVFQPGLLYIGDMKKSLNKIINSNINVKTFPTELKQVKEIFDKREVCNDNESFKKITSIISSIRNSIGKTGILCSDIGLHKQYAGLLSKTYTPNTFLCSNVCGSFGFGLPAALGAKLAKPNERVALICGDGGFHSTSQDLETAVRYNLPIVIVLLKDNAFGLIKYYQHLSREEIYNPSVEFGNVDFVKLAEANGMKALHLDNVDYLETIMNDAFEAKRPLLIEIPINYEYKLQ